MSNSGNSIKHDSIREIPAISLSTSYQQLGGVFLRDIFRLTYTNWTFGDIYLSTDGVTDMMKFSTISARCSDNKTNDMFVKSGTQYYIRFESVPADLGGWFALEAEYV
jgi:hypothetical protein